MLFMYFAPWSGDSQVVDGAVMCIWQDGHKTVCEPQDALIN